MSLYQFIVMKGIEHGDVAWENGITLNVVDVFRKARVDLEHRCWANSEV